MSEHLSQSGRWRAFSDDEVLELLVNLRSADEAVDFRLSEHLLGELLAESKRRVLEVTGIERKS